ncbi:uncharacterized protein DS421_19g658210 [Arachis hypogaea]|uniref:Uncharacterized protein n=1 Tax=Arachis hypogaea TaxID=3818 RepID=A0A6B9V9B7_ARAHY|nr:uncharacterized protein DS421_19g658210 [Arachis hypogaea]
MTAPAINPNLLPPFISCHCHLSLRYCLSPRHSSYPCCCKKRHCCCLQQVTNLVHDLVSTATHFLAAFVYHLSATSNAAAIAFSELLRRGSAFFVTFNSRKKQRMLVPWKEAS